MQGHIGIIGGLGGLKKAFKTTNEAFFKGKHVVNRLSFEKLVR